MYTVIKTIKGRRYIYEQRTWREGRRVRTQSRYLGPLEVVSEPAPKKSLARRVGEFIEAQGPLFSAADKYAELAEQQALEEDRAEVVDDGASSNSSPGGVVSVEASAGADAGAPSGGAQDGGATG